jgi:pSer/pThr/pTyr-binding forkhead associated (FHA) protein
MARLVFSDSEGSAEFVLDTASDVVAIGRSPKCDIRINNPSISRVHAEVRREWDGGFSILDNASSNGTFVNGVRVTQSPLKNGDVIMCGEFQFLFAEDSSVDLPAQAEPAVDLAGRSTASLGAAEPRVEMPTPLSTDPVAGGEGGSADAQIEELRLALEFSNRERDAFQDQVVSLMLEVNRLKSERSGHATGPHAEGAPDDTARNDSDPRDSAADELREQLAQRTAERDELAARLSEKVGFEAENARLAARVEELERASASGAEEHLTRRFEAMRGAFAELEGEILSLVEANRSLTAQLERARQGHRS